MVTMMTPRDIREVAAKRPSLDPSALKVGLVYDLRDDYLALGFSEEETAEFDQAGTIDAIEGALREIGHSTTRIGNADRLMEALLSGQRWDLVFNVAEGLYGSGREALVPAVLDHFQVPYTFSGVVTSAVTLHKAMAKHVVRDAGIPTAPFTVVSSPGDEVDLPFPLFVKPLAEGTGKGVDPASIVENREELVAACNRLLERYRQPVLVETLLPGRELTVGVAGSGAAARVLGTLEVDLLAGAESGVYSYVNKERCEELVEYRFVSPQDDDLVARAEMWALAAWRVLECCDGGRVDVRCDAEGTPCFLEVNPLAGLHPFHSDLPILCSKVGMPYVELIRQIVDSAWSRALASS